MQRILVYTVGPLTTSQKGKRYILTVQCSLTKWAEAYAILNQHATMSTSMLREIVYKVISEKALSPTCLRKCASCWSCEET